MSKIHVLNSKDQKHMNNTQKPISNSKQFKPNHLTSANGEKLIDYLENKPSIHSPLIVSSKLTHTQKFNQKNKLKQKAQNQKKLINKTKNDKLKSINDINSPQFPQKNIEKQEVTHSRLNSLRLNINEKLQKENSNNNHSTFNDTKTDNSQNLMDNTDNNHSNNFESNQVPKNINDLKNNKLSLSVKIASTAKNLNKIMEENFANSNKTRKNEEKDNKLEKIENKEKEKTEKIKEFSISINNDNNKQKSNDFIDKSEFIFHTINGNINNYHSNDNVKIKNKFNNKQIKRMYSPEINHKDKNLKRKSVMLNHSLELRNRHKMKININNGLRDNNFNQKSLKQYTKNDFRQMNTSPFIRSKKPIQPRPTTNFIKRKSIQKKNSYNVNHKKSYSPQKSMKSLTKNTLNNNLNDNNNKNKQSTKIIDILKRKDSIKNKTKYITTKTKKKNSNNKNEKETKTIEQNTNQQFLEQNKENIQQLVNSINPIIPIKRNRAQSQTDINKNYILKNLNNIYKENKTLLKLESLCKKGFAGPGIKKNNQDNFFIYNNFINNQNFLYIGVCDGHGMYGQDVSCYLVNNLPQNMNNNLLENNIKNLSIENFEKLSKIIINTFLNTNNQLICDGRIDCQFSGSTCVTLFYTPSKLICSNVGDSRCILGKFDGKEWKSKNLSRDHKPNEMDEFNRIIKNNGRIESYKDENGNCIGPERVWLKEDDVPGLAMSRSFGDEVAHLVGVITEPEINEYFFLSEDKFIIVASDGLWEFISSDECVMMVKDFYLNNDIDGALTYLYKEASKRWILEEEVIDDITILIAFLK